MKLPRGINYTRFRPKANRNRRGAMLVLVAFCLVVMVSLSAFAMNLAYMELTRTELRLANDAAAKAAIVTLGQTQSLVMARASAKTVAARHRMSGSAVQLQDADIEFGYSSIDNTGRYNFALNQTPINAVRVVGGRNNSSMPMLMGSSKFNLTNETVATRVDHDVCFVIDRSGSMAWDLSNIPFTYPGDQKGRSRLQNYFSPPHTTLSRWASVQNALNEFKSVVYADGIELKIGLVTYSSTYKFGDFESQKSQVNRDLTFNFQQIQNDLITLGTRPIIGDTNIEAGLQTGVGQLSTSPSARMTANKTIILLSDGVKTEGGDPIQVAANAKANNMIVHTIAFSEQADLRLMQAIAAAGGGQCYQALSDAALRDAFRSIAATIPSIITK